MLVRDVMWRDSGKDEDVSHSKRSETRAKGVYSFIR